VNYITTVINNRAPGMTWFRMPLSIWSRFITAILGILALPILSGAGIMLLFDQTIGTHFFDWEAAARCCCGSTCSGSSAIPRSTS
jgi:cytochrome c oxidase subunit 1